MAHAIALDLGSSSLKRLRAHMADVRPVPDLARGGLRIPAGLLDPATRTGAGRAAALASLARESLADARRAFGDAEGPARVAFVVAGEVEGARLRESLGAGFESVEVVAAPIALALAAGSGEDRATWLVVDAGHAALRAHVVSWHRLGDRTFPLLEKTALEEPALGGLALDEALAKAAWVPVAVGAPEPALPPPEELSARGFFELKELAARVRGPLARRVALAPGAVEIEVPAADVKAAFAAFLGRGKAAGARLAQVARESGATRIVAGGALLELAPLRSRLESGVASTGAKLEVLEAPLLAAARGGLRALEASPVPRAAGALRLLARQGTGVAALELVPAGAALPGRFGPARLEVTLGQDPLELLLLEGDDVRVAQLPRRAPRTALELEAAWTYEAGWRLEPRDGPGAPLVPASEDRARTAREALAFSFDAHAESSAMDAAFVFVATQGEGPILSVAVEALLALARRVQERAREPRLAAVATGDHPQGAVRPRYATLVQPFGDLATLERFARAQAKDPVDGVDAPEALECALAKLAELPWRADAEKVAFVLTDVPPHEKNEPPFCSVDWREQAKKVRGLGVTLVPVFLEGAALAPEIVKRTRAFLEALREGTGPLLSVRAKASEPLLATVDALAARKRLDARARDVLARVAVTAR